VDDILLVGKFIKDIESIKSSLNNLFKIKDLGCLKFFLGMEIVKIHEGIYICQRKYALNVLADARMLNDKPATTPMVNKKDNFFTIT